MGLNVAKSFLVVLMSLVIIGVTSLIIFNSLQDSEAISEFDDVSVTNETGAFINSTGYTFDNQGDGSITVNEARNASDGTVISSTEYNVNNSIDPIQLFNATSTTYSNVNVDYTYEVNSDSTQVVNNASDGVGSFFENTGTWLSLLTVVILILIISAVIFVVNRFGSGGRQSSL